MPSTFRPSIDQWPVSLKPQLEHLEYNLIENLLTNRLQLIPWLAIQDRGID